MKAFIVALALTASMLMASPAEAHGRPVSGYSVKHVQQYRVNLNSGMIQTRRCKVVRVVNPFNDRVVKYRHCRKWRNLWVVR